MRKALVTEVTGLPTTPNWLLKALVTELTGLPMIPNWLLQQKLQIVNEVDDRKRDFLFVNYQISIINILSEL